MENTNALTFYEETRGKNDKYRLKMSSETRNKYKEMQKKKQPRRM
jgi:hypothetical protein